MREIERENQQEAVACCFVVVKIFAQIKLNGTFLTLYVVDVLRISMVFFSILSLNKATD